MSEGGGGFDFAQSGLRAEQTSGIQLGRINTRHLGTEDAKLDDLMSGGALDLVTGDRTEALAVLDAAIDRVSTMKVQVDSYGKYTNGSLQRIAAVAENAASTLNEKLTSIDEAEELAQNARLQMRQYGFDKVFAEMENSANRVMSLLQSAGGVGGRIDSVSGFAGGGAAAQPTLGGDSDELLSNLQSALVEQQAEIDALQAALSTES